MADFTSARDAVVQSRAAVDAAAAATAEARESQRARRAALDEARRRADLSVDELKAAVDDADAAFGQARAQLDTAHRASRGAQRAFADFTDPRLNVELLPDSAPFVMLPIRIETRFRTGEAGPELLVRIYPDDCWVDTFEPMLSADELVTAKRYWQNMWRAGGNEDGARAAWRDLVAAHGSDRARYIVDTYAPTNAAAAPTRASASDEILVIATQAPPSAAETAELEAYWTAVWRAGGAPAAVQAARAAFEGEVGVARAAELVATYVPFNLADPQPPPGTVIEVSVAIVVFPADPATTRSSWSQAPQVRQFPERFLAVGVADGAPVVEALGAPVTLPLYVGPDPSADATIDPDSVIHPDGPDLHVPNQLKWMVDFDAALDAGMAVVVPLTAQQAQAGFDRLLVVGVHMAADAAAGAAGLAELLTHHHQGRSGLSLVPQGTPTHNTTGAGAGFSRTDDADRSFDDRGREPLFALTNDTAAKRDGQWVAEALGVDPAIFTTVHGSDGRDQIHARAMQGALWPATLGYWMDKMMAPVFADETVAQTRAFFTEFVSGRGSVPALRIGGQPYGVLPTTAFTRIRWIGGRQREPLRAADHSFLANLSRLLANTRPDWEAMSRSARFVGDGDDPYQTLLSVVGLHPSSVEFYTRYAESIDQLFNHLNFWSFGPDFFRALVALGLDAQASALLRRLGYIGDSPDILQHLFFTDASECRTVIDDRPMSETDPVRPYTDAGENYIAWLRDAARTSLDALIAEDGFTGGKTPQALLYLYLRHALMFGYYDAGYGLHKSAAVFDAATLAALKPEPSFVHVAEAGPSESRFALLYKAEPAITGNANDLVAKYIADNIGVLPDLSDLEDQTDALDELVAVPTAELFRVFAEHMDTCSYRYDAWLLGLVNLHLRQLRARMPVGAYVGAYAWVEDLRPSTSRLRGVELPADLADDFAGATSLWSDPANGGFVHAPSLTHARAAAVLRAGYLANASQANPGSLAVNLSSDRVRDALEVLEGIRNGQSLGALLGYRFERGLHDDHGLAEVDKFIFPMRKAFPLAADALAPTATPPGVPIEAIEARNVLDGRKLVLHVQSSGHATYPYGLVLPSASSAEAMAIDAEANRLRDMYDAIADVALAEGVFQAVQGNFDRIGATLDAYSSGNFPPEPEVVRTPPSGIGLTHRIAIHLRSGLAAPAGASPAAQAQPAIDAWLADVLPPLNRVACTVTWADPATGANRQRVVTLADLDLSPIDVLDLVLPDETQAMTALDDRVVRYVHSIDAPRPDADLRIEYLNAPAVDLSVFEASALVRAVKTLITRSRPLRPTDAELSGAGRPAHDADVTIARARVATPAASLDTLRTDMEALVATLEPLAADPTANRAAILADVDTYLDQAVDLLVRAAGFRLPSCGWGFIFDWRHAAFAALMAQVDAAVRRWNGRLADFDAAIAAYDALSPAVPDDARFTALQTAELLLTTTLAPRPPTPAAMRAALAGLRTTFVNRVDEFAAVLSSGDTSFSTVLAGLSALLPATDIDREPFDVGPLGNRAATVIQDLATSLRGHVATIQSRVDAATGGLNTHDTATSPSAAVDALQSAVSALFGEDVKLVPEFAVPGPQGDEWANALTVFTSGQLLHHLEADVGLDDPAAEWLHGVARVRPMVRTWELVTSLVDALRGPASVPELTPVQFPADAGSSWAAMQLPPGGVPTSDTLCYTAHYSVPFDKTVRQCGLLIDEWTEVIPATNRTTGITFNFDRPDNEPPQSILVVTPASSTGTWQWDDIVGALNETLDLAKIRAVEPSMVDGTPYAMYVPATIMAATFYGITIATNLAVANDVYKYVEMQ